MARRKIIFVSQFFPPVDEKQTGGTISNRNFFRFLARDSDVIVLTFDRYAEKAKFRDEPFRVVQKIAPSWRAPQLFLHWNDFVRAATKELVASIGRPDVLIATTSTLSALDAAPPLSRKLAIIRAFENFGLSCSWVPFRTRIDLLKGAIVRRFSDARILREADAVLTNSFFMRDAISKRFSISPERIRVLNQSIDFSPSSSRAEKNTVGFVHRGADKNIGFVLQLAQRDPELVFQIFGRKDGIPESVPGNVKVFGWMADRSEMFASSALWIVPSLWAEPFGRVSIEAQAANRAVLVARNGGLSETVADDRFVIDGFDPDAWLSRIRQLLLIPQVELMQVGKQVRERFSQDAHDRTIIDIINSL